MPLLMCVSLHWQVCAAVFSDDFSRGFSAWRPGPGWSNADGDQVYRADYKGDSFSWNTNLLWDASWSVEFDVSFHAQYDPLPGGVTQGGGGLAFSNLNAHPTVKLLVNLVLNSAGGLYVEVAYLDGSWHTLERVGWLPTRSTTFHVRVVRLGVSPK